VNQLVAGVPGRAGGRAQPEAVARARLRKAFETGLVEIGDRTWSREDLYDR